MACGVSALILSAGAAAPGLLLSLKISNGENEAA